MFSAPFFSLPFILFKKKIFSFSLFFFFSISYLTPTILLRVQFAWGIDSKKGKETLSLTVLIFTRLRRITKKHRNPTPSLSSLSLPLILLPLSSFRKNKIKNLHTVVLTILLLNNQGNASTALTVSQQLYNSLSFNNIKIIST